MEPSIKLPDAEDLTQPLTEEQLKAVEESKNEGWDTGLEAKPREEKEVKPEEKPKEPEKEPEGKETPEEKEVREKAEVEAKELEETEAKETDRLEKKAKKLEKTVDEVKTIESDEKVEQERIEKRAEEEGMTVEEVKEEEAKDLALAERHGKDPIKVARALRKETSEYGKLKNEVEELREYKSGAEKASTRLDERHFNSEVEKHKDDIIDKFRSKFPKESEDLSDDVIFERGKALIRDGVKEKARLEKEARDDKAETKRSEVIKDLPEEYKSHRAEIKKLLADCDTDQILDKGFDVEYLAMYARGKKYTPEYIKSLEDSAYKRGSERAKIVPKVPTSRPKIGREDSSLVASATAVDRARAREMYGRKEGWSESKMIETYMKDDKKDDF